MSFVPSWTRGTSPMSQWKWLSRVIWSRGLCHPWTCSVNFYLTVFTVKLLCLKLASREGLETREERRGGPEPRSVNGRERKGRLNLLTSNSTVYLKIRQGCYIWGSQIPKGMPVLIPGADMRCHLFLTARQKATVHESILNPWASAQGWICSN